MTSAKEILLKASKNVFTNKSSENLAKMRGDGLDFCEIRPYQFGDDVRKINFSASGKTGELQTNIFNENKQLKIIIGIVLDASLHFGSQKLKIETIAEVVATLGFSAIKQKNQTQVVLFDSDKRKIFALNNKGNLLKILEYILELDLLKTSHNYEFLNNYFLQQNKSLSFVISDFYHLDNYALIANKHQLNAIIVRDKLEEYPNFKEELSLINAQNSNRIEVNFDKKLAKKYQKKINDFDKKLFTHFAKYKTTFGKIYTCDDVFSKLRIILK